MDREQLKQVVSYGALAPSPHNLQSWLFIARGETLSIGLDPKRLLPVLDPTNREIYIGLGAAIENLRVAARHLGYRADVTYFPQGEGSNTVASLQFDPGAADADNEFELLARRETNRRPYRRQPLDPAALEKLRAVFADEPEFQFFTLTEPDQRVAAARLIGEAERTRFEHSGIHQEIYEWLRFSEREAQAHRDGLALDPLEIRGPVMQRAARFLLHPPVRGLLGRVGLNRMLALSTYRLVRSAPALCLLTARTADNLHYVRGGELFQRVSHQVAAVGLAMQATSAPLELVHLLKSGHEGIFSPRQRDRVQGLRTRLYEMFSIDDATGLLMLFRLGKAPPPSARSLRRRVDEVFRDQDAA
jgi:hypothetical protein